MIPEQSTEEGPNTTDMSHHAFILSTENVVIKKLYSSKLL